MAVVVLAEKERSSPGLVSVNIHCFDTLPRNLLLTLVILLKHLQISADGRGSYLAKPFQ